MYGEQDHIYSGQTAGFALSRLEETVEQIKRECPHVIVRGVTSFPCYLYDEMSNRIAPTANLQTVLTAAGLCRQAGMPCDIINTPSDRKLGEMLPLLTKEDTLVVMADHGNDPSIGHSRHTREFVPLLVCKKGVTGRNLGIRRTLSDVGATACRYLGADPPQNGTPFLDLLDSYERPLCR